MFQLSFLEADRPLVKSYALKDGVLSKESYPRVWEFTSHTYECRNLMRMEGLIKQAADSGWCMLKGVVQRELQSESRAGSTDANALTEWVLLDIDRSGKIRDIDHLMALLGLGDVSYIVQYSASYGVETERGVTAHVAFMLDKPLHPDMLKQWLTRKNLSVPELNEELKLTRTNNALSFPLDVTTCQNDKLIYIAPPLLGPGVASAFQGARIQLVVKTTQTASAALFEPKGDVRPLVIAKLDELRTKCGVPKRGWGTKTDKSTGLEVLSKCDSAVMSALKQERGFTYFNLNGGDSWGYFHPDNSPEVIRNFKGEPNYLTKELLPEYWNQVQQQRAAQKEKLEAGEVDPDKPSVLVFRDFRTSLYYNGTYDPANDQLLLATARNETQLQHYLAENNLPAVDFIPVWNLGYNPQSNVRVDREAKTINTFSPSIYMKQDFAQVGELPQACPFLDLIFRSSVSEEDRIRDHYLNWIAVMFMDRRKTGTAWTLQGCEGSGKGAIFHHILRPLLGDDNAVLKRMRDLEDPFNGYYEDKLLVAVDEVQIVDSKQGSAIMADLKTVITEPTVSIRRMHAASYTAPSYVNMQFNSNMTAPIVVSGTDRRMNIGDWMIIPLDKRAPISQKDFDYIRTDELARFANFLAFYERSIDRARKVIETTQRAELQETSANSIELTARALLRGDLPWFWDNLPAGEIGVLPIQQQVRLGAYQNLLLRGLHDVTQRLTRDEIHVLFTFNCDSVPTQPAKFAAMLRHHRVHLTPMRVGASTHRALEIEWKADPQWINEKKQELAGRKAAPTLTLASSSAL